MRELKVGLSITERDTSSVNKYLNEIGRIPLLSTEQEIIISRKIREGDHAAMEHLIRTNLRFVVSVAKKYQHRGLSLGDIINEGNWGLIKACSRYDETKGFKFISFAVWWIRQSIMLAIAEQTRTIRLPLNLINSISRINKVVSYLEQQLERYPTTYEIAEEINADEEKIIQHLSKASGCLSLNAVLNPETGSTLLDVLANSHPGPDYLLTLGTDLWETRKMLKVLSRREKTVLLLYFGLEGNEISSLDEIALSFNLSRERVRQIKDTGLRKLRMKLCKEP